MPLEPAAETSSPGPKKMSAGIPLRCQWVGPMTDGLAWLSERLSQTCLFSPAADARPVRIRTMTVLDVDQLLMLIDQGEVDRLIMACDSRLSYDAGGVEFLQRTCTDVPFAVACGTWWDGFRRTGLGPTGHLMFPWYRWWDGWLPWLEGDMRELPIPAAAEFSFKPELAVPNSPSGSFPATSSWRASNRSGAIVGNCRQTCQGWGDVAQFLGHSVSLFSWQNFLKSVCPTSEEEAFDWIVWDDSSLDTAQASLGSNSCLYKSLGAVESALPQARWIAALNWPRADQWLKFPNQQRWELLGKPDCGHGLLRLLHRL